MTQQYMPNLGQLPDETARRDAVHIAVAPVVAGMGLRPGQSVALARDGRALVTPRYYDDVVGIVDPYLQQDVLEGQRFWLFLLPNTVTSLRHVWEHPAFRAKLPEDVEKLRKAVRT